jgi:alkylation response protein AidB-like acyl-CoA dehydrogenase
MHPVGDCSAADWSAADCGAADAEAACPPGSALSTVDLGSEVILKFGSHEQKRQFLLPLARGEKLLSIAFGESEDVIKERLLDV